jgi:hypothetical protein
MERKNLYLSVLAVGMMIATNIVLIGLDNNVAASYPSPQMEVDTANQWAQVNPPPNPVVGDNQIDLKITTQYFGIISPQTRVLPGTYYEVIRCSDDTVLASGYTGADGTVHAFPAVPNGQAVLMKIKIYMGKSDGGVCGQVLDANGSLYWGISSNFSCQENWDYTCLMKFKDSGDSGDSFVGAAAIYATIYYSTAIYNNNVVDNDAGNGDIKVKYYWPSQSQSDFFPKNGQTASYINISGYYFNETNNASWNPGYDSVRHQIGHLIQYEKGFEENYWPGDSLPHTWHIEKPDFYNNATEWAYLDGFADFWAAYTDVVDNNYNLVDDQVWFDGAGIHVEIDIWYMSTWINCSARRGERTEGFIADLLWDMIDTAAFPDQQPGGDDDSFSMSLNNMWTVININDVHTIFDFWDNYMYQGFVNNPTDLQNVEEIYLSNNVGRYTYLGNITDQNTTDNFNITYFEILGMNPTYVASQRILARYLMNNTNSSNITLDSIDVAYIDQNNNPGTFGTRYSGFTLQPNHTAMEFAVKLITLASAGTWTFWPHWTINSVSSPQQNDVQMNFDSYIWNCDFTRPPNGNFVWPDIWVVGDNSGQNPNYLWYVVNWNPGAPVNPTDCAWCAGQDSNSNIYDPSPPVLDTYRNNQDTYMRLQGNYRYIGLRLIYDLFIQLNPGANDQDKLDVRTYDGTNWIIMNTYTKGNNGANWQNWGNLPIPARVTNSAFKAGNNMRLDFNFISDNAGIGPGVFVDMVELNINRV